MSVDIPQPFVLDGEIDVNADIEGGLDLGGKIELDTDLGGKLELDAAITIPTKYVIGIDQLPKIQLGLDPVELRPVDLSLRLKEIPSVRLHLPADFKVGLSLLGTELLTLRLCGKAQAITEDYIPNPCERRGTQSRQHRIVESNRIDLVDDAAGPEARGNG